MGGEFASASLTAGQLNAIIKKLGGPEEALRFLRNEVKVSQKWRERDGIIYFSVTSDGMNGTQWIHRLNNKGFEVESRAKVILTATDFIPSCGARTDIAIIKGTSCRAGSKSFITAAEVEAYAATKGFVKPNAEAACLIREMFTSDEIKAMGLGEICIVHELIMDWAMYHPNILCSDNNWLLARPFDKALIIGTDKCGFAFAVPPK